MTAPIRPELQPAAAQFARIVSRAPWPWGLFSEGRLTGHKASVSKGEMNVLLPNGDVMN